MKAVKMFCVAAAMLLASAGFASSFTTTASSRVQKSVAHNYVMKTQPRVVSHPVETTTSLQMSGGSNQEADTDGIEVGKYLLFFVMLANIWAFR